MNKYQEALNYLKGGNMFGELSNEALESIEVLIDKETPRKPIIKRNTHGHIMWGTCDVCKSEEPIWFGGRCSNNDCGQRVLWKD